MDKQNMEFVYRENVTAVYKYLFCLTHNADIAEELTQETFYQAVKGMDQFKGACKVSVWLCQIAKHLWYKECRKRQAETAGLEEEAYKVPASQNIEADCLAGMEKVELFRQLHSLDEITREVMYLRLSGELSFAQIGDIVGKTENWARVTFYRGKQKLAKRREEWNKH